MSQEKVMVALDNFEKCLLISGLSNMRNIRIEAYKAAVEIS